MYGAGIAPSEEERTYACSHLASNLSADRRSRRGHGLSVPSPSVTRVKPTVQVKLLPSPDQAAALEATLHACNAAANTASQVAFSTGAGVTRGAASSVLEAAERVTKYS